MSDNKLALIPAHRIQVCCFHAATYCPLLSPWESEISRVRVSTTAVSHPCGIATLPVRDVLRSVHASQRCRRDDVSAPWGEPSQLEHAERNPTYDLFGGKPSAYGPKLRTLARESWQERVREKVRQAERGAHAGQMCQKLV